MDAPANPVADGLTILLADDHEVMRLAMRHALQPLAREISWVEAADAAQVDAVLAGGVDFDLALVDLNMPGTAGTSTAAGHLEHLVLGNSPLIDTPEGTLDPGANLYPCGDRLPDQPKQADERLLG